MAEPKPLTRGEVRICDICRGPIGYITFRVRWERHILDPNALQQQMGLEMMLGNNPTLASIMGATREFSKPLDYADRILCQDCMMLKTGILFESKASNEPEQTEEQ